MADPDPVRDDEIVLRHIPGDKDHLAEGPRDECQLRAARARWASQSREQN
jgi:hypothetical protein